ncbi:MAG: type II secretion system GspH family protein [Lachnospiraceae bacterium]|nr:type II secretion system GspH family protein [Lachnospiraceae bacterium]
MSENEKENSIIRKEKRQSDKGFTLVELIVVLVILSILAAILIPELLGYIDKANEKQYIIHAKSVYTAAQSALAESYGKSADLTDSEVQKSLAQQVATMAEVATLGTESFEIRTRLSYSPGAASLTEKHLMYTVGYVKYVENGQAQILVIPSDGSQASWDTKGEAPDTTGFSWTK